MKQAFDETISFDGGDVWWFAETLEWAHFPFIQICIWIGFGED